MKIRRLADGREFEGPDGPVPEGFDAVSPTAGLVPRSFAARALATATPLSTRKDKPGEYAPKFDVPTMVGLGAGLIPGEGAALAVARPAIAALATEALTRDPMKAITSAADVVGGQVLGGLARGGARIVKAGLDKTVEATMKAVGKAVPAFEGKTAAEVINRIIGGDGMRAASKDYGDAFRDLWQKTFKQPIPAGTQITDTARELLRKAAPQEMQAIDQGYARASTLSEWITDAFKGGVMPAEGKLSARPLQEALLDKRAVVRQALPDVEKLLRMPPESAARDVAATGLLQSVGGHVTPYGGVMGYLKKLPHAPKMAGEGMTPELAAQAARALGTVGIGTALTPTGGQK